MKNNGPVTNREFRIRENAQLVTKTDLKGIITYVNKDFAEAAKFPAHELMGQPHNVIRHPDVPSAVFADLWSTIKSGRPWAQCVKNRCKDGDHYWVRANVSPIVENGVMTGYLSVRYPISDAEKREAEEAYRNIAVGKLYIKNGRFYTSPFLERMNVIAKFSLTGKLGSVALMLLLPTFIVGSLWLVDYFKAISVIRSEKRGMQFISETNEGFRQLLRYRGLRYANVASPGFSGKQVLELQTRIQSDTAALEQSAEKFRGLIKESTSFKPFFEKLKAATADLGNQSFGDLNDIVNQGIAFIDEIKAISLLDLDPEPESYYLIIPASQIMPRLTNTLGRLRAGLTFDALNDHNAHRIVDTAFEMNKVELILEELNVSIANAVKHNQGSMPDLKERLEQTLRDTGAFLAQARRDISAKKRGAVYAEEVFAGSTKLVGSLYALQGDMFRHLNQLLSGREFAAFRNIILIMLLSLGILALCGGLFFLALRGIRERSQLLVNDLSQMESGVFSGYVPATGEDELDTIVLKLRGMKNRLGLDMTETKILLQETLRNKVALDNVSANIMIADAEGTIIYMNKAVKNMMLEAEAQIQQTLPNFRVSAILGSKMDGYHKVPENQRNILQSLQKTYEKQIHLGDRTFDLVLTPVVDENGERLGGALQWIDRTSELKIQKEIEEVVSLATKGDYSVRIDLTGKVGFMKLLSQGLNEINEITEAAMRDLANVVAFMSQGDMTQSITADYQGLFGEIKVSINKMTVTLSDLIGNIASNAGNLISASQQVNATAQSISQSATEAAANVEESSASLEEMVATIVQNTENTMRTSSIAVEAAKKAVEGGRAVTETVEVMRDISKKIELVEEIAYQTNLLALNAAIEAARAGDHGRGFAVVASEVRELAERSRAAAQEIGALVQRSVGISEKAGELLQVIVPTIQNTADLVQEVNAASQQQKIGVEQMQQSMHQLDSVTQSNASASEEMASTAEELSAQASTLQETISSFKLSDQQVMHAAKKPDVVAAPQSVHFTNGKGRRTLVQKLPESRPQFVKFD